MTAVFELRQYTLHPGRRDALVELFERELVETQEACGIRVIGTFLDLDDPDRFVWFRGFPDMVRRHESLTSFYGGPTWKAFRDEANATMIDSDDVLLLRLVEGQDFPAALQFVSVYSFHAPIDDGNVEVVQRSVAPLTLLRTEAAENTYRALPVRQGEHVIVAIAHEYGVDMPSVRAKHLRLAATSRSKVR